MGVRLANPNRLSYKSVHKAIEDAARAKGRRLVVLDASSNQDFDPAFVALARARRGALVVTSDPLPLVRRDRLVALAADMMLACYAACLLPPAVTGPVAAST